MLNGKSHRFANAECPSRNGQTGVSVLLGWLWLMSGGRHRQVASAWQNVDGAGDLLIVGGDEDTVRDNPAVSGGHYLKAQLQLNKLTVMVDERRDCFERRVGSNKILEGFEHEFVYDEVIRLQLMIEVDALGDAVAVYADHTVIHQFAAKRE